jgi:transcriptional regulator
VGQRGAPHERAENAKTFESAHPHASVPAGTRKGSYDNGSRRTSTDHTPRATFGTIQLGIDGTDSAPNGEHSSACPTGSSAAPTARHPLIFAIRRTLAYTPLIICVDKIVSLDRGSHKHIQGTLDILILKTLTHGPQHGYGVSTWIHERTAGELGIEDAALYQALHRLERRELIVSEWGVSDNNRRAKYYEITRAGRRWLLRETATWHSYARAVASVLNST